jgi:alkylation response protein AidB-like acyl-CoA dehydrogenase
VNTILSAAQQAQKELFAAFALEHLAPISKSLEERRSSLKEFLQKAGQRGYLGITVPKEYGGQEGSFLHAILFTEALAQHEPGMGLTMASHTAVIEVLKKFGSDSQKSRYLPLLARGECLGSLAFSEVGAGTDFKAVSAKVWMEKGLPLLTGLKTWVVNADISGLLVVLAKDEANQLSMHLVDMGPAATLKVATDKQKLGLRSASTNDVEFASHPLQVGSLIGAKGNDESVSEQVLYAMDVAKVVMAAAAVGLVEGALDVAAAYAKGREQFGEPIANFQAIQWKLADISAESRAARLLTYRAAWSKDEGPEEFRRDAAMCKSFAAKVARTSSGEALQVLGAAGLSTDSPLERFYRDAKVMEISEGTSEYQKVLLTHELGIA